jgi:hypothetical protein
MLLTNTTYRLEYGNPYIRTRTEDGWTADLVFNRDNIAWSGGSIFYYWGISGETVESNYADNNLSFGFTNDGRIIWKSVRYTPVDGINGTTNLYTLTSGATPTLCDDGTSRDFNITITFKRNTTLTDCDLDNKGGLNDLIGTVTNTTDYKDWLTGATENKQGTEILSKKWYNERNNRLGTLKIYLNGNQIYKLENFEEIIPSQRASENELIQSWGSGTDGMNGIHTGFTQFIIQNVEYYEEPLSFLAVKEHYKKTIEPNFDIIECNYPCGLGPTPSPSVTPTMTPTPSIYPTPTPTPSIYPTNTPTPSITPTRTPGPSVTPTNTLTPTTSPTGTPDPTRTPAVTPDPSPSVGMTRTPTPTPTHTPAPTSEPGFPTGPFTFDFDYMVVEYFFTDGTDMDTMAYLTNPAIMNNDFGNALPGDYVGTCASSANGPQFPNDGTHAPYLIYGGDNTSSSGTEAVLFDLVEFKNQRPSDHNIEITFTSTWYGTPGQEPVIMRATMWKSGTPEQVDYTWTNTTAIANQSVQSDGTIITSNTQNCEAFEQVAKFVYNTQTYDGYFVNPGQSGVTPTPTPSVTSTLPPTPNVTNTLTPTPTATPAVTPTNTSTPTPTATLVDGALLIENGNFLLGENGDNLLFDNNPPTPTPTNTPTHTLTPTPTSTPAPSVTPTNTPTPTVTQTNTLTPTPTHTVTTTPTVTNTPTGTMSPTITPTNTPTNTPTLTPTSTPEPLGPAVDIYFAGDSSQNCYGPPLAQQYTLHLNYGATSLCNASYLIGDSTFASILTSYGWNGNPATSLAVREVGTTIYRVGGVSNGGSRVSFNGNPCTSC